MQTSLVKSAVAPKCLLLLILVGLSSCNRPLEVSLGRYDNLVIAIHRSVPDNATLIEEIKSVVQDASRSLVLATRRSGQAGGLAFGNVTILVPETWPERYPAATWQLYSKSQMRVGPRNPRYGPVPHTEGVTGCGRPGEYTHYPVDFFLDKAQAERLFGDRAKLMVHEFGHLRWGLLDEAPQENDPQFYIYNSRFYPSRCTDQLDGKMANKNTGLPCKIDRETLTPEPDCIFIPDEDNRAVASLMGHYYVKSLRHFCDHSSHQDEAYQHNRLAPTQHNRLCRSRSVWQIIGYHEDFQKERPQEVDFTPNIDVLQVRNRDVFAVLDISGSMNHPNNVPINKLKAAMVNFIRSGLEPSASLGIVTFSSGVKNVSFLEQLGPAESDTRKRKEQAVTGLSPVGKTDIGDGLMQGLRLLLQARPQGGGSLFLVSDGEEDRSLQSVYSFDQAAAEIKAAGVTVNVLGVGPEADKRIGDLARDTGGNFYSSFSGQNSFDLLSAMLDSTAQADAGPDTPVVLHSMDFQATSTAFALGAVSGTQVDVLIDASARGHLLFVLLLPYSLKPHDSSFNVTSPNGTVYGKNSAGYKHDAGIYMLSLQLSVEDFHPGTWIVRLTAPPEVGDSCSGDCTVAMVVTTKPSTSGGQSPAVGPIVVGAEISTFKLANNSAAADDQGDGFSDVGGVTIHAALTSGTVGAAVIGAEVTALVRTPDSGGANLEVALLDNGAGDDLRADDGTYMGRLSPRLLPAEGDYLVTVAAKSVDGRTRVIVAEATSIRSLPFAATAAVAAFNARANYTVEPVTNLTRSALAGSFKLETFIEEEHRNDRVPPSPIASLDLVSVNSTDNSIILAFNAVGDDYDQGTAHKYEAYWSTSAENLTNVDAPGGSGFWPVLPENVHLGNLTSPSPAGTRELLGLRFPADLAGFSATPVVYVTVRAVDAAGNRGRTAFPASAAFRELPIADTGRPRPPNPDTGNPSLGVVIGVVVSVVVIAVVIAAVYFGLRKPGGGGSGGGGGGGGSGIRAFSSSS